MREIRPFVGKRRGIGLQIIAGALCLMMLPWAGLTAFATELSESRVTRATESNAALQMTQMKNFTALGGQWTFGDTITSGGDGDIFALSDVNSEKFIYEADVKFNRRTGAASLVFYSGDQPHGGSYVANIDLSRGDARLFGFGQASANGEFTLTSDMKAKSEFHLRVETDGQGMVYSIDGMPVAVIPKVTVKPGARLGLLTYSSSVTYSHVRYCELDSDAPALEDITGLSLNYTGGIVMKETVPYTVKNFNLTVTPPAGTSITASAKGAKVTTSGNQLQVSEYSEDFDIYITLACGNATRTYAVVCEVEADPQAAYREQFRPQLHYTPSEMWMNDPNGLVYDPSNNTWHLFYQHNQYGMTGGIAVWGHAVSDDLMHWKELDIAIDRDHLGEAYSGSAVVDEDNTTGFFTDNKPGESKLVALFTSSGGDTTHGVQKQSIAYSKDHGVTWIRPTMETHGFENPILPNDNNYYDIDFRDPKIFRHDGKWFMVTAGGRARLFVSDDLINWTFACDMGFDSECPDFYPLAVDGDPDNIKWVYTASGKWYVVGRLEKISETQYKFVEEGERITYNGGDQVYATQSFYNDGTGANRRIAISWIVDHAAEVFPGKTWNGAMTIPYEQTLRTVNGRIILFSDPVAEIENILGELMLNLSNPSLEEAADALRQHPGNAYELTLVVKPGKDGVVNLFLRQNSELETVVTYSRAENQLAVLRGNSSMAMGVPSSAMVKELRPRADGTVEIRVLMDTSLIEVFGNAGEAACSGTIFPADDAIFNDISVQGSVELLSLRMREVTSIWHKDEVVHAESGIYELLPPYILLDQAATFALYQIAETGKTTVVDATWSGINTELAEIVSNKDGILILKGKKEGTMNLVAKTDSMQKQITVSIKTATFNTNLQDWTSEHWAVDENGLTCVGTNGNAFAFSSGVSGDVFTYTGVVDFTNAGGCLGLVYATPSTEHPEYNWYCSNITTNGNSIALKMFANVNGQYWEELGSIPASGNSYKLTVTYDGATLSFTVGDLTLTHKISDLAPGALGVVSWMSAGSFNDVYYYDSLDVEDETESDTDTESDSEPDTGSDTRPNTDSDTQPNTDSTTTPSTEAAPPSDSVAASDKTTDADASAMDAEGCASTIAGMTVLVLIPATVCVVAMKKRDE